MNKSHIKSTLALKGVSHPIDEHTKALFHYNWHAISHDGTIKPLGPDPEDENCIGYWDFSKEQEIAYDLSGNDNHGTIVGATWGNGRNGKALNFNGSSNYILLPGQSYKVNNQITLSAWAYKDNWQATKSERIISCTESGGWQLGFNDLIGYVSIACYISGVGYKFARYPLSSITEQGWHHIAGTFDGTMVNLYFDGELVSSVSAGGSSIRYHATNGVFIGAEATSHATVPSGGYWNGKIQDMRIYNRALSQEEIQAHYNEGIYTIREDGKYGGAIAIEEGTTNLITNFDLSKWFTHTATDIDIIYLGDYMTKVVANKYATNPRVFVNIPSGISAGDSVTFSAHVKTSSTMYMNIRTGSDGSTGNYDMASRKIDESDQLRKYSVTAYVTQQDLDSGYTGISLLFRFSHFDVGDWAIIDKPQIEIKPFATSFVDGAREGGKLIYPNPIPDASEFTISLWAKVPEPLSSQTYETLLYIGDKQYRNNLVIDISNNNRVRLFTYNSSSSSQVLEANNAHTRGEWHHVAVTRDSSKLYGYVNGEKKAEIENVGTVNLDGFLVLGDRLDVSDRIVNVLIDELRIDDIARTDEEIYAWYVSSAPHFPPDRIKAIG